MIGKNLIQRRHWLCCRPFLSLLKQSTSPAICTTATSKGQCFSTTTITKNNNNKKNSTASSSVSTDEVTKFSGMDQQWWDPKFHPLIAMNPVRIKFLLDIIKRERKISAEVVSGSPSMKGLDALDIGCGGGLLSESLARLGANVTAIDPSQALVDIAKEHAKQTGDPRVRDIDYRGGISVEELAASEGAQKYDVVCLLEVLEHATDVSSLIQAASSLVKEDSGILFVSTINRTWKSHLLTIVGAEYIMGYIPVGTHNWNQYLSPEEVTATMKRYEMEPINISGMVLNKPPLFGNWDWRIDPSDTDVNWIGAYRKASK